jgi:hypothetical protein
MNLRNKLAVCGSGAIIFAMMVGFAPRPKTFLVSYTEKARNSTIFIPEPLGAKDFRFNISVKNNSNKSDVLEKVQAGCACLTPAVSLPNNIDAGSACRMEIVISSDKLAVGQFSQQVVCSFRESGRFHINVWGYKLNSGRILPPPTVIELGHQLGSETIDVELFGHRDALERLELRAPTLICKTIGDPSQTSVPNELLQLNLARRVFRITKPSKTDSEVSSAKAEWVCGGTVVGKSVICWSNLTSGSLDRHVALGVVKAGTRVKIPTQLSATDSLEFRDESGLVLSPDNSEASTNGEVVLEIEIRAHAKGTHEGKISVYDNGVVEGTVFWTAFIE